MLTIQVEKQLSEFKLSLSHEFECQGVTAFLGVSGSGKSTIINLINGLIKPDSGHILLDNILLVDTARKQFIPPEKRHIGTVFQDALLFPHYTVLRNLTYGMQPTMQAKFNEIISVLNIDSLLKRYPAMLSGGEKQRVSIGRALLSNPQLLLMDEPLSALDMPRKKELLSYINNLVEEINIPIFYVTHNINEVRQIAQYVAIIEQGKMIDYGETQTVLACDYLKDWL